MIVWGTYYLAKKNLILWDRVCARCGQLRSLRSYDAFKWGHLYFLPLIPLGRKHVADYCGHCEWGLEARLSDWQAASDEAQKTVTSHWLHDKSNADYALEALAIYSRFGTPQQAHALLEEIEKRFGDHPTVEPALFDWYVAHGRADKAAAIGEGHRDVDPEDDLREVAHLEIMAGEFQQAKTRLLSITKPEARDFADLVELANGLSRTGDDRGAYEVYQYLFEHLPEQSKKHTLALQRARKVERRLGIGRSILPAGASPYRDAKIGAGIVAALVVAILIGNVALTQFQTLYFTNNTTLSAEIAVDGHVVQVLPGKVEEIGIAEGAYEARLTLPDGFTDTTEVKIENTVLTRITTLLGHNVFVYDVLGAYPFVRDEVVYSSAGETGTAVLFAGHPYYIFRDIDYRFREAPIEIRTDKRREVRVALHRPQESPAEIMGIIGSDPSAFPGVNPWQFAEGQIRGGNRDPEMLAQYRGMCTATGQTEACQSFLSQLGLLLPPAALLTAE